MTKSLYTTNVLSIFFNLNLLIKYLYLQIYLISFLLKFVFLFLD